MWLLSVAGCGSFVVFWSFVAFFISHFLKLKSMLPNCQTSGFLDGFSLVDFFFSEETEIRELSKKKSSDVAWDVIVTWDVVKMDSVMILDSEHSGKGEEVPKELCPLSVLHSPPKEEPLGVKPWHHHATEVKIHTFWAFWSPSCMTCSSSVQGVAGVRQVILTTHGSPAWGISTYDQPLYQRKWPAPSKLLIEEVAANSEILNHLNIFSFPENDKLGISHLLCYC